VTAGINVIKSKNYIAATQYFQLDDNSSANLSYGLYRENLSAKPALTNFTTGATYEGRFTNGTTNTAILNYFNNTGGMSVNGSPYDNGGGPFVHAWDFGNVQDFDGGSVGKSAIFDTGHRVSGKLWQIYLLGWHPVLKFPTADQVDFGISSLTQTFQGGSITTNDNGSISIVAGGDNLTSTISSVIADTSAVTGVTKTGAGTLTLSGANTYTGGTTVQAGKLVVNRLHEGNAVSITGGRLQVQETLPSLPSHPAGNNAGVSRPSSLSISNNGAPLGSRVYNGTLDLGNNDLIVDYTSSSPAANIEDMVRAGYNGGNWQGTGITSSTAANAMANGNYALAVADNALLTNKFGDGTGGKPKFSAQNVDDTTVLVKFTHRVDLDLDGLVTPNDAIIFATNFVQSGSAEWIEGDVDYDGLHTQNDAIIFATFYNGSLASLPEPAAGISAATLAVFLGVSRRRR
jgi:autotransporter-associated beta strand protein